MGVTDATRGDPGMAGWYILTMRTDESFRECWQPEHHQEEQISPFSVLPIDMIKSFPIDYMHQSCLGVMKKLLLLWTRGRTDFRMSSGDVTSVSERLVSLKKSIPDCFARKPRGLKEIERWKATEFRQFALYTGKIVIKGVLQDHLYEHFLSFSTALCILVSRELTKSQGPYANQLLKFFVEREWELYGEIFLVYNVHSLLHLAEDAQNFGSLDRCSAFKFESHLHHIKKKKDLIWEKSFGTSCKSSGGNIEVQDRKQGKCDVIQVPKQWVCVKPWTLLRGGVRRSGHHGVTQGVHKSTAISNDTVWFTSLRYMHG